MTHALAVVRISPKIGRRSRMQWLPTLMVLEDCGTIIWPISTIGLFISWVQKGMIVGFPSSLKPTYICSTPTHTNPLRLRIGEPSISSNKGWVRNTPNHPPKSGGLVGHPQDVSCPKKRNPRHTNVQFWKLKKNELKKKSINIKWIINSSGYKDIHNLEKCCKCKHKINIMNIL